MNPISDDIIFALLNALAVPENKPAKRCQHYPQQTIYFT